MEIRNGCIICLCGICLYQQPLPGDQRRYAGRFAAGAGCAMVLSAGRDLLSCDLLAVCRHRLLNPRWKMYRTLNEAWQPDDEFLHELGIEKAWLTRYPAELSGGEMQRFCIARALAPETQFIIADEISTMLDVITQAQVWNLLLKVLNERKIGLIAITHSPELAERVCDRVIDFSTINNV